MNLRRYSLVADAVDNLDHVNMATAFDRFGKFSNKTQRNFAADDRFRRLMARARDMCSVGQLDARAETQIRQALARMSAAGISPLAPPPTPPPPPQMRSRTCWQR